MILQKQQVAWWLKCFEITNMAWVRIFEGNFFINIFQALKNKEGIRVNQVACNTV